VAQAQRGSADFATFLAEGETMRGIRHAVRVEAGLVGSPRRNRRAWPRWLGLSLLFVLIVIIALAAALAVTVLYLARDTPALASLLKSVPAQTTVIYDSAGQPIAELYGSVNRVIVSSSRLPLSLKQATVAVEDKRFYSDFHGIDLAGIVRAGLADLQAGRALQGASTITEQYVKNAYLGGYDGSLTLKFREAILAWELTDRWSKERILTAYLNTVYYGDGAYGVEAAAKAYFHRDVAQLTLAQSALLAGLPQDPSGYSPIYDPDDALARRNVVLRDMASQGYITPAQERRALKSRLRVYHTVPSGVLAGAAYFVDYVEQQLVARLGAREVFAGGLRVYTSLDSTWQNDALGVVRSTVSPLDFGFKPSAALVAIDPATGYIRSMVGGLDFARQQFNLASQARRQPGSAMKPFVLAAAIEKGMDPFTTYYSSQSPVVVPMGAYAAPWVVHGDGPGGPETVAQATVISDNAVFARLSVDVGPANTVRVAHAMGITSPLAAVPSITLGTSSVTPLEMADAYATLADGGIHHSPQAVVKVVASNGRVLWRPATVGTRAIPAGVASTVTQVLEQVASRGTGATTAAAFPYPRAGKTGTTENSWDVWYVGYTPQLATSVWMGDMNANLPMNGAFGEFYCAPMWAQFTAAALAGAAHPDFAVVGWPFGIWAGAYATAPPLPSPSSSPSASAKPTPTPTATRTTAPPTTSPTASPTSPPTPTTPPTPTPTTSTTTKP
jgi:penicillin-binding protein 1A